MADASVTIDERDALEMVQVSATAVAAGPVRRSIERVLGASPPEAPNRFAQSGETRIVWIGPHRWLVVMPRRQAFDLAAELSASIKDDGAAVVDLGASRRVFTLSGPASRGVLAKALPLDVDPTKFLTGHCAQSAMEGIGVLLLATAADAFELFVYRGFAQHFLETLIDLSGEFDSNRSAA